ncbi:DUF1269 domain-containing protein [Methanoculleus oceani]|uniref:Membrane protein of uknown function UCP014873 n=1 Tax=Methanoculleus oceani TaxID=2184756 RepID=A0ABD4TAR1_9EURY|nr:DUF1269 domain-containing protein [Methanoculleus sp. CWC-02]MCM2465030.1 hypothetical protein [Methanoculleus sp. CWC-02]
MSDLIAIAYDGEETAFRVRDRLIQLTKEHVIELEDLVVVVHHRDGKTEIKQATNLAGMGALSGAFWGLLIGLIFFAPIFGLAIGAITGALAGRFSDYGIDDNFIKEVAESVGPGNSAVFLLVKKITPDRVVDAIREFGGHVIRTSLSEAEEANLQDAFGAGTAAKAEVPPPSP